MIRNYSRRQPGQSLPLLVIMLVVIIGMVGLSVDAGNAYGQQRRVQNIANAGAVAAMSSAVRNNTNAVVWEQVLRTSKANRVDLDSGNYDLTAHYITYDGVKELGHQFGSNEPSVTNPDKNPPKNIERIQVTITERVGTYFARVVGREDLVVNANGNACLSGVGPNTYPIGVPLNLTNGFHKIYEGKSEISYAQNSELWDQAKNGIWTNLEGKTIELPFANGNSNNNNPNSNTTNQYTSGSHISWLNWGVDTGKTALANSMAYPGNLQNGFKEATPPNGEPLNLPKDGYLDKLDWVDSETGVASGQNLDAAIADHKAKKRIIILPVYSKVSGNGTKSAYHITDFYRFRIEDYHQNGNNSKLFVKYMGKATDTVTNCSGEPPFTVQERTFNVEGVAKVNRVFRTKPYADITHDIVLVMDTSGSMSFDWYDRRPALYNNGTNEAGYDPANARIHDAKQVVKNFVRNFDTSEATGDPDARISFLTFGGEGTLANSTKQWNNWTLHGCKAADVKAGTCKPEDQWKTIQANADKLTAKGGTPGPYAFEQVINQLQTAQATRNGKTVRKVVIFATDGVFNICGATYNSKDCPKGDDVCPDSPFDKAEACKNDPKFQAEYPRPMWQGQQLATKVKGLGASIYMVAFEPTCTAGSGRFCFDPYGLPEMSSGDTYYHSAHDEAGLAQVYETIRGELNPGVCVPQEREDVPRGATVRLTKPGDPLFAPRTAIADTVEGTYQFKDLEAGTYAVTVDPWTYKSPEDQLTRTYSRVRNGLDLSEEGKASIYINPQFPDGATVNTRVLLSLPTNANGVPHNGCTMPK